MATAPAARPILCAVLDGDALGPSPRERASALFRAGVDWIQLRDRALSTKDLLALARALTASRAEAAAAAATHAATHASSIAAARDAGAPCVVVNKRSDVALAAGADGVHLGLDAADARSVSSLFADSLHDPASERAAGRRRTGLLGASIHGLDELEALVAEEAPLAYVHLAPIWAPRSKPAERPELGLEVLARAAAIAAKAGLRILAQGGLDAERAAAAVAAGAGGIAVTGILGQADDPAAAARALRSALDRQPSRGGRASTSAVRAPGADDPLR